MSWPIDSQQLKALWRKCGAETYGFTVAEFEKILIQAAEAKNFGLSRSDTPSPEQKSNYVAHLNLPDLILARACARGIPEAWDRFLLLYQESLRRAAISITGSSGLGHDLADAVYADLYGLETQNEQRISPLDTYMGTGSLRAWLCVVLSNRHIDNYRLHRRERPLEDYDPPAPISEVPMSATEELALNKAVKAAIIRRKPEEQFLLKAYFLEGQTFQELGELLQKDGTTVARRLKRLTKGMRKHITRNLRDAGLAKGRAEELFKVDPRDFGLNLKNFLQD